VNSLVVDYFLYPLAVPIERPEAADETGDLRIRSCLK
jgi:hypothetical protein